MTTRLRRPLQVGLVFAGFFLAGFLETSHVAWAERPVVQLTEEVRASLRSKGGIPSELISRVDLLLLPSDPHWSVAPFVEARWDLDSSNFSRVELGAEFGVKPFSWWKEKLASRWFTRPLTWFSIGQAFYQRWYGTELSTDTEHNASKIRSIYPTNTHPESKTRLLFDIPTPVSIRSHAVGLYAVDEYIVDLNQGRAIRNEIAAGFKIALAKQHEVGLFLGWRHIDLVHLNDTDQFEGGVKAKF